MSQYESLLRQFEAEEIYLQTMLVFTSMMLLIDSSTILASEQISGLNLALIVAATAGAIISGSSSVDHFLKRRKLINKLDYS